MILQRSSKVGPPQTSQAGVAFGSMRGGVADFVASMLARVKRSEEKCLPHYRTEAFRSSRRRSPAAHTSRVPKTDLGFVLHDAPP